jgi:hypothetical protein
MKSEIYLISLEMEVVLSMNLTNKEGGLRLKRRSFRVLLKRLRLHLSKRKIRFSAPN